ncbi:MAG: ATP synthase F0 subunit C [Pirellulales bacterium]|nr:ATP synthase F0 subunit C [Pirellulales bacterium]
MNYLKFFALAVVTVLITAAPAAAQGDVGGVVIPGAIGAGLVAIGGAYGIGRLAGSALEGMSRQPEMGGSIQTAMIIAAALIEGFVFYGLYICSTQNPWGKEMIEQVLSK